MHSAQHDLTFDVLQVALNFHLCSQTQLRWPRSSHRKHSTSFYANSTGCTGLAVDAYECGRHNPSPQCVHNNTQCSSPVSRHVCTLGACTRSAFMNQGYFTTKPATHTAQQ
jgi:hypothetical protein